MVPAGPAFGLTAVIVGGGAAKYVNLSPGPTALTPPGPRTVTSTVAIAPGGLVTSTSWSPKENALPATEFPNCATLAPLRPVPKILTGVPPFDPPRLGETASTSGTGGGT